ncbi:Ku protein [Pseudacidovorax sp. RU35E]|uniref:non-homologous end joining protein Ku n=1 Tax=Pseudacidovorax sp. RU35E TaxID=1907403 RepID=UPI000956591D|nr:Ku protein [Pseudacidovorax sp. RU35E]SIR55815.1 DNA end-binding protein Ku [Pseudacidovorax sp. RU35E]
MPASSPRVLWKGAISFGLVHIPVALYSATQDGSIDFDWLDKRSMDHVGYKRINKKTGKEIARENIVRGVQWEDGQYVVLTDKEIADAYPRTLQTIEIERFVPADGIPFIHLDRPYYTAPIQRGAKVYALLREALVRSGRIGVARVVIQTKEHLAALVPAGPGLVLNLLRWGADIRSWEGLPLPDADARKAGVNDRELKMAEQLIEDMSGEWKADEYEDRFRDRIMALVERKAEAGQAQDVAKLEPQEQASSGAKILDLTELLQRSLRGGKGRAAAKDDEDEEADEGEDDGPARTKGGAGKRPAAKAPAKKAAAKSASARKAAPRRKAA